MDRLSPIGLQEALALVCANIRPLPTEQLALSDAVDRTAACALHALVDSPSVDASLKEGYAVRSAAVAKASDAAPIRLTLAGRAAAGSPSEAGVTPHNAVRVLTGAAIPPGADAVVSEEYTRLERDKVVFMLSAEPGRNITARGSDVARGEPIAAAGDRLSPALVGLLAAAGHSRAEVFRLPRVAILATGDEVVAPGEPLPEGKVYASNMATLAAWCRRFGLPTTTALVRDDGAALEGALRSLADQADAILTSGGAWTGERDLIAGVLRRLQWRPIFQRVRMGPGKAAGFGLLCQKPIFILPGGPSSNLIGFLQIALPGLLRQSGRSDCGLPQVRLRAAREMTSREPDWTHFVFGRLEPSVDLPLFFPLRQRSRLQAMAQAQALVALPEGCPSVAAGGVVSALLLEGSGPAGWPCPQSDC